MNLLKSKYNKDFDKISNIILQAKRYGYLSNWECRKFIELGVPILSMLAKNFKVNLSSMRDIIDEKGVYYEDLIISLYNY